MGAMTGPDDSAGGGRSEEFEDLLHRVYVAAVRLGTPTRPALVAQGFDPARLDAALTVLVERGLLAPGRGVDLWDVPPPREALSRHADRMERWVAMSRMAAPELDAAWRRAVGEARDLSPDTLEPLFTVGRIADRISNLHRLATRRVWWMLDTSPAAREVIGRAADDPGVLTVPDGVEVRVMVDTSLMDDPVVMAQLDRAAAAGHRLRFGNGIPVSLLVCDSTAALIDLSAFDVEGRGSVEVRAAAPVAAVARMLDSVWQLATDPGPAAVALEARVGAPLRTRDGQILSLLISGATDKVIARQLGISVRTVERRIRIIMQHLGAATRFQAGAQAVRRGWV